MKRLMVRLQILVRFVLDSVFNLHTHILQESSLGRASTASVGSTVSTSWVETIRMGFIYTSPCVFLADYDVFRAVRLSGMHAHELYSF